MELTFELIEGIRQQVIEDTKKFNKTGKETKLLTKVRDLVKHVSFEEQVQICNLAWSK